MNKHKLIALIVLLAAAVLVGQYCLNYYSAGTHRLQRYHSLPLTPLDPAALSLEKAPEVQSAETLLAIHFDQEENSAPLVSAWVVQVATIHNKNQVQKLSQQLKVALACDVFIRPSSLQGVPVYRIMLGPFTDKETALTTLSLVQEKLKITGILKQFTIEKPKE